MILSSEYGSHLQRMNGIKVDFQLHDVARVIGTNTKIMEVEMSGTDLFMTPNNLSTGQSLPMQMLFK